MLRNYKTIVLLPFTCHTAMLIACLLLSRHVHAQVSGAADNNQEAAAVQLYKSVMGYNTRLYSGSEYIRTYPMVSGHPFFYSDSLQQGFIVYDGILYPSVDLNYDIVRDLVIIKGPQVFSLQLSSEKIDSFSLGGKLFLRLSNGVKNRLPNRFFEVVYNGEMRVLAIHSKRRSSSSRAEDISYFIPSTQYFILHQDKLHPVSGKSDLLAIMGTHKEAIKKFVQQQKLSFRKDLKAALIAVASFYSQIPS